DASAAQVLAGDRDHLLDTERLIHEAVTRDFDEPSEPGARIDLYVVPGGGLRRSRLHRGPFRMGFTNGRIARERLARDRGERQRAGGFWKIRGLRERRDRAKKWAE